MSIFSERDSIPNLFRNRDVLKDRYSPDTIVGRDAEKDDFRSALRPVWTGTGSPDNLFISGPAGTGKTVLTRAVMSEVQSMDDVDVTVAYLNCKPIRGETALMLELANEFREPGDRYTTRGYSTGQAREKLFAELERADGTVLVVLDELDTIPQLDTLLYSLPRAHEHGLETAVGLIAISNNPDYLRELPADAQDTLTDTHITFSAYDAHDIGAVLKQRVLLAFRDTDLDENGEIVSPVITEGAVQLAAATGAKHAGDARMSRDILRMASDLCIDDGAETVRADHVKRAADDYHRSRMVESVSKLSDTASGILYALIDLYQNDIQTPRTAEVFARYESVQDDVGAEPVSKRQVQNHLAHFEEIGLITTKRNSGGGGYYANHELQYDPDTILTGLGDTVYVTTHTASGEGEPTDADADGEPANSD